MRPGLTTLLSLALSLGMLSGCSKDESQRCVELRQSIEAQAASLERTCWVDQDCFVTLIRPSTYVAISTPPNDPALDATISSYQAGCPGQNPPRNVFSARCIIMPADGADVSESDLNTGDTSPAAVLGQCVLYAGDAPVDLDALEFPDPEVIECNCTSVDDCGRAELCMNGCQCLPRCEAACTSVELCSEGESPSLAELGLGTDIETCTEVCEVNLSDPLLQTQVPCLATAACGQHAACLAITTP